MAVTIKDVAREAGVSVATVSRAINGQDGVAVAVRDRVLEVASRLDYAPHQAARALSSRRTRTIGVVLPDLHGEFFSELIRGIGQEARAHGLHLLLSAHHGDPGEQGSALQAMRGRVDGVLLMAPTDGGIVPLAGQLSLALPAVLVNAADPEGRWPAVMVDGHAGALRMTRHLLDAGRRRIAFVSGPDDNRDARERRRGYEDALREFDPAAGPVVVAGDFDQASGARAAAGLLERTPRPDAIFAANDAMAIGCLRACADAGVDVPGEVAVAGFDDIPLARLVHPALTTMQVDIAGLGASALRLLVQSREGASAGDGIRSIVPQLVIRGSSQCAGSRPGP